MGLVQVMEEGERLSKKQMAQENTIKKLRGELAELRSEKGSSSASLAAERQKVRTRLLLWQLSGIPFRCVMGDWLACPGYDLQQEHIACIFLIQEMHIAGGGGTGSEAEG